MVFTICVSYFSRFPFVNVLNILTKFSLVSEVCFYHISVYQSNVSLSTEKTHFYVKINIKNIQGAYVYGIFDVIRRMHGVK